MNETKENAPNQEVKGGGKKGASRRKSNARGCWECSGKMSKCEVFQNTMEHDQVSPLSPRCVGKNVRTNQAVVEGERKRKIAQEVRKDQEKGKEAKEDITNRSVW